MILLPEVKFYQPISLLADIGILILVVFMGIGIYVASLPILQRFSTGGLRWTGYTLLSIILCAFIIISFVGPFSSAKGSIAGSGTTKGKPNILWIVMETTRADHLSCYGYYRNTTPNIDRIAEEGLLFTNACVTNSICAPSRATILTGKHTHIHPKIAYV